MVLKYSESKTFSKDQIEGRSYKEESKGSKQKESEVDLTSKIVGDFGKWQLYISLSMALLKLPIAWYQLNIIFMAPPQEFWCEKPKILTMYSEEEWRQICAPRTEEHPCLIFDPDILVISRDIDRSVIPLVSCKKFVYDLSVFTRTITSEWNLVCNKHWLVHLTQVVMMCGVLFGGIIFGVLADKYGRKIPLMMSIIIQGVCSYLACVIPWYWTFLTNWFILALASGGIGIISFVICMEVVSNKWRTIIPVLYQLPFGLGNSVMASLAYYLRDWRQLEFALATLSSLFILYWFWIPESPRWLLATGQTEKALEVLKNAAKTNNRKFDINANKHLIPKRTNEKANEIGFMVFLKSKNMRMKTVLLSMNWFCMGLAFYGFSQYLGSIGDDIFLTVAITGIISIPGTIVCMFVIMIMGRKVTLWIFQFITGLCFVFILVMPRADLAIDWPRLVVAGIGFAGMAGAVPALYLLSGELYPTVARNVGVGGVTLFARLGSMMAPVVVSLGDIMAGLPLILLAAMSFAQMLLLVPLPETKDSLLPDTLEQAENFTRNTTSKGRSADSR